MNTELIPAGYMAKRLAPRPDWLKAPLVNDIYSLSACVSKDFADYINYWRHNGYWLFDSPALIDELAATHAIDLSGTTKFYYQLFPQQFDEETGSWQTFAPEQSFPLSVEPPASPRLEGFDVVTFWARNAPEHSPLSCNGLAGEIATNSHCLLDSLESAIDLLETGKFLKSEPGPFRIFSVHTF